MIYKRTYLRLPDRDFDLDFDLDFDRDLDLVECDLEDCRLRLRCGDTDRCLIHRQTDALVLPTKLKQIQFTGDILSPIQQNLQCF